MLKKWKSKLALLLSICLLAMVNTVPSPSVNAASTVMVNVAAKKQMIRGFGASSAWCGALSDSVMNALYSNIGLSILRVRLEPNEGWKSGNYNSWKAELSNAKKARDRGAIVFATPWTAPASMKTNNSTKGEGDASLKTSSYAEYANYLKTAANYFSSNGAPLYAISVQNEPDWSCDYDGCRWTAEQLRTFVKAYGASVKQSAKLMMPESLGFNQAMSNPTLNDADAEKNVSIIGGHLYGAKIQDYPLARSKGKELWETEHYITDLSTKGSMELAKEVNDCMVIGNMNAYTYWWINDPGNGLLNNAKQPLQRAYVLGQFAKFIRNGYYRVDATSSPQSNVSVSAYTGDGKVVIVAINQGTSAVNQTFNVQGAEVSTVSRWTTGNNANMAKGSDIAVKDGEFTAQLPAQSITTYVGEIVGEIITPTPTKTSTPHPVVQLKDGWYYIKNCNAQKYLQVTNNEGKAGQNVELGTGTGVAGQKWYLKNVGEGYFTLKSSLGDFMVDVANGEDKDGANIGIYSAYSGAAQQFAAMGTDIKGAYIIGTKVSSLSKVLDDYDFSKEDGANVCQWTLGGKANQEWFFEEVPYSGTPTEAPTETPIVTPKPSDSTNVGNLKLDYTINNWGSGYQVDFKVTNDTDATVNNWTLKLNKSEINIDSSWNVNVEESGEYYIVTPVSWNASIEKGNSIEFGVQGTGSIGDSLTYTLN